MARARTILCEKKSPGRPKDLKKQAAILKAALKHFLKDGFTGASMDAIAADAGVSKLTIYSHFNNKDTLFKAVVQHKCQELHLADDFETLLALPAEKALMQIGQRFLDILFQQDTIDLHRVIIAESVQRPKISEMMYEAGPSRVRCLFAEFLGEMTKRKKLAIDDTDFATQHFFALLKGEPLYLMLFNLRGKVTAKEKQAHLKDCIGVFMRAYQPHR